MLRAEMWKEQYQVVAREKAEMAKELQKQSRKRSIATVKLKRFQHHKRMLNDAEDQRLLAETKLREKKAEVEKLQNRFT